MKKLKITTVIISLFLTIFVFSSSAFAEINIVTTVPDLAAIAKEIGGDNVKVKSLGKGYQNPHYVDAKPSYIVDLNKADMLIYVGLDLEIGWLPLDVAVVLSTGQNDEENEQEEPDVAHRERGDGGGHFLTLDFHSTLMTRSDSSSRVRIPPACSITCETSIHTG